MRRTGIVLDPRYQDHEVPHAHPERPERIAALIDMMRLYHRDGLVRVEPRRATIEQVALIHDPAYIDYVRNTSGEPPVVFDPDTHAFAMTYITALLAAGGLLELIDKIMCGDVDNGFAMVRPPGHHAETERAMGFCFFNNAAIAARYLQTQYGLDRILIMDWDVHHGNGTERSFYSDESVLYVSIHQSPHYPGTGAIDDVGEGDGKGYTVNIPLRGGFGDEEYADCFREIVEPVCRSFDPDFVLISAGFDCHVLDPLSNMRVTSEGFGDMAGSLLGIADECADGRCAAVLEGGYNVTALKESVAAVLDSFAGGKRRADKSDESQAAATVAAVKRVQGLYWPL